MGLRRISECNITVDFYSKTNYMHQCLKSIDFGMTLYMFRTVFPSIIRSSRLYIQQPNRYCFLLVSKQTADLFDIRLLLYVQSWTPDDGRKDRPKHVQCHSKINKFETSVHLVGFTIELYYDARPYERQIKMNLKKLHSDIWDYHSTVTEDTGTTILRNVSNCLSAHTTLKK